MLQMTISVWFCTLKLCYSGVAMRASVVHAHLTVVQEHADSEARHDECVRLCAQKQCFLMLQTISQLIQ
jgi:hypothetical protein